MSIERLAEIYSSIVSSDHHKTRDGMFYVVVKYDGWDGTVQYVAEHPGYMNDFEIECATFKEAEDSLRRNIIEIILKEIKTQREILSANPGEYDYYTRTPEELDAYEKETVSISQAH